MKPLIISRKDQNGYGGLSRFFAEFVDHYPKPILSISPANFYDIFRITLIRFDVIYLCDATLLPIGVILKKLLRKPLFVSAHGLDLNFPNKLYQFMLTYLLPHSDSIILDSNPAKRLVNKLNFPQDRVFVINPGVSTKHLQSNTSTKLPLLKNKTVLLTIGNLVARKGHVWFIKQVMQKLSDNFIYLIVGQGSERKNILKTAHQLHLKQRVFLLGKLTHSQLSFVFKKTNIYVCPNQALDNNFEGFGIAAAEAAALGLPVIASSVDGIPEAIKNNKNGLLVEPKAQAFIKAINKFNSPKKIKQFGRKAKHYTKIHYNWPNTIGRYLKIFNHARYLHSGH